MKIKIILTTAGLVVVIGTATATVSLSAKINIPKSIANSATVKPGFYADYGRQTNAKSVTKPAVIKLTLFRHFLKVKIFKLLVPNVHRRLPASINYRPTQAI